MLVFFADAIKDRASRYILKPFASIFVLLFLLFSGPVCHSHQAIGLHPEFTSACLQAIDNYFIQKFGIELSSQVLVHVAKSHDEYRRQMIQQDASQGMYLAERSLGVTSNSDNLIFVDGSNLSDEHFFFVLAHEMVHRFQFEYIPDIHNDYVLLEGLADVIAHDITGYPICVQDHGIPYESLKSKEGFFSSCQSFPDETIEQVRFYCRDVEIVFDR